MIDSVSYQDSPEIIPLEAVVERRSCIKSPLFSGYVVLAIGIGDKGDQLIRLQVQCSTISQHHFLVETDRKLPRGDFRVEFHCQFQSDMRKSLIFQAPRSW